MEYCREESWYVIRVRSQSERLGDTRVSQLAEPAEPHAVDVLAHHGVCDDRHPFVWRREAENRQLVARFECVSSAERQSVERVLLW